MLIYTGCADFVKREGNLGETKYLASALPKEGG